MSEIKLVNINDERFWDILFDEAYVEGNQAERIKKELENIAVDEQTIIRKPMERIVERLEDEARFYNSASDVDQNIRRGVKHAIEAVAKPNTRAFVLSADKVDQFMNRKGRWRNQMTPEEQMLISAVRYALGRMSYIVGITCEFVATVRGKLSKQCIEIIIRDIEEEMKRYHDFGQLLGMECDERTWENLLKFLKAGGVDD